MRRLILAAAAAALALACAASSAAALALPHRPAELRCHPTRISGEWYLNVAGPGTVHQVTAQHRTVRLPAPVRLRAGGWLRLDWSGAYAPGPGRCAAR